MTKKTLDKWQFGDFQTPIELANKVTQILKEKHKIEPNVIIEPSCGKGSFIKAAIDHYPNASVIGFDINPSYINQTLALIHNKQAQVKIKVGDFFSLDWNNILDGIKGRILIIGNPPWVTSSELGLINSKNLPEKSNFQNRRGIEAITGSGNFDISEWMLLQHAKWLAKRDGTIALLCKYSVARKVMRQIRQNEKHIFFGHIYKINAKRYFKANVEACLFVLTKEAGNDDCEVYENLDAKEASYVIGERDGFVVKNIKTYEKWSHLRNGESPYIWRSGIKHDCSKIMELEPIGNGFVNGLNEYVELEQDFIYPLMKSSDVGNCRVESCRKMVIVTQTTVGEDTHFIKHFAPKTWLYLVSHSNHLCGRKSSIYRNKPPFSIFGVGDYTFKPWKIAISSLYKKLNFCLIGPFDGRSVVFDDTVNFLSFTSEDEAKFIFKLVTSSPALKFYEAMIFWDEKRPITTNILMRLSLKEVAKELNCENEYDNFGHLCSIASKSLFD